MTAIIQKKILLGFLKKARMAGEQIINESILNFESDGLKILVTDTTQQARVSAWLKKEAFETYEEIGKIGMNDLENVLKVLDRFGDKITLEKEGNLLTIKSDNKKVDIELVAEEFIKTDVKEPELEFTDTFTIGAENLKEIFKDVSMNKDAVLSIKTIEKNVRFSNTGKYKFQTDMAAPTCKGGVEVSFGKPIINAATNLDGVLDISVASDYPAKILEKTEHSIVTLIVAPRVESE